jgi:hypothetical protein
VKLALLVFNFVHADAVEGLKARLGDRRKVGGLKLFLMTVERVV